MSDSSCARDRARGHLTTAMRMSREMDMQSWLKQAETEAIVLT